MQFCSHSLQLLRVVSSRALLSVAAAAIVVVAVTGAMAGERPARLAVDPWLDGPSMGTASSEGEDGDAALRARLRENWSASATDPGTPTLGGRLAVMGAYGLAYGVATKVGSRYGLGSDFKIVRLESAYAYDLVGHTFLVREIGGAMTQVNRWAGHGPQASRRAGVWWGAFGSEMYMELINGFMPTVRFDPLDPIANFTGAWLATGGRDLAQDHPHLQRFSLEFGYQSWRRAFGPSQDDAALGNIWHDHPNGRFGVGYSIGPARSPWFTLFATYEITSLELAELKNRFGMGLELHPVEWTSPLIARVPGGDGFLRVHRWLDRRILIPGVYFQLFHLDTGPFSDREPFHE